VLRPLLKPIWRPICKTYNLYILSARSGFGANTWAPKLKSLDCTASFDLKEIEILENHELRSKFPDNKFTKFVVDLTNVCHSPELFSFLE